MHRNRACVGFPGRHARPPNSAMTMVQMTRPITNTERGKPSAWAETVASKNGSDPTAPHADVRRRRSRGATSPEEPPSSPRAQSTSVRVERRMGRTSEAKGVNRADGDHGPGRDADPGEIAPARRCSPQSAEHQAGRSPPARASVSTGERRPASSGNFILGPLRVVDAREPEQGCPTPSTPAGMHPARWSAVQRPEARTR
jgi:hypothetical protein